MKFKIGDEVYGILLDNDKLDYILNKDAFIARQGICYEDYKGNQYTYQDLYDITGSDDAAETLFNGLRGDTLEKYLANSWHFNKCPICGNWIYDKDFSILEKSDWICNRCRPIRTRGVIHIDNDPYEDDRNFYHKREATFRPGITTLVGCNGIGKSTLLKMIQDELSRKKVPVFMFDNTGEEGGGHAGTNMLQRVLSGFGSEEDDESIGMAASLMSSSEGECIKNALIRYSNKVIRKCKRYDGFGEYWFLFDAIDSGLSLDVMEDVKQYLFGELISRLPQEANVYIISSSNSYELSEGTQTFSVAKMSYVNAKTYNAYKKLVHNSLDHKQKRDYILDVKHNIGEMEYEWKCNGECLTEYNDHKPVNCKNAASLTVGKYEMVLSIGKTLKYILHEKKPDGNIVSRKLKYEPDFWHMREDELRSDMHGYVCNLLFKDWRKKCE